MLQRDKEDDGMKKSIAIPAWCVLLSLLLTGCMGDVQTEGPTINDMVMPTVAAAASEAAPDDGAGADVQVMANADSVEANTTGGDTGNKENGLLTAAFEAYPTLDNCQLNVTMKLEQTFTQGQNAFVVPSKLQGTIKTVMSPLVKVGIDVSSSSSFASEEVEYAARLYMEQTQKEWIAYGNETGKWVRTVRSAAGTPAVKIAKADWKAFASAVQNAKSVGDEAVDGVQAAKLEASMQAKEVYELFGAQLCYVIPGMQEASQAEKASDKSMQVFFWISGKNEILKIQFDAGAAWEKLVMDSFSARSTDDFDISAKNIGIIVTVTKLNTLDGLEIPQEAKDATATPSPAGTPKATPKPT